MSNTTATAVRLTANETAILRAFPRFQYASDTSLADMVANGLGRSVWTQSFTDDAAAAAGITTKAVRGVITSLVKKGLITCQSDGPADERTITVTDAGLEQVAALQDPDVMDPEHECIVDAPTDGVLSPAEPDEVVAEQDEAPVSEPIPVVWPESVAKLFFRALGRDGANILANAHGLARQCNQAKLTLTITGDPDKAAWLADSLPTLFHDANEHLKQWRKTSPNYKRHSLATTEGRRDAYTAEQDYLRGFCWAVAGTFTNDMLASDGVQAGLAYVNQGE